MSLVKSESEVEYWRKCYIAEGYNFNNPWYKELMLTITQKEESFFADKVVADFGCGPRGSLEWCNNAQMCLGLDVLVPEYFKEFNITMKRHKMAYVTTTEEHIPLPEASIDVLFTFNSFDHTLYPAKMASEIIRILKPGGLFAGSFNLHEPPSACEPQCLDTNILASLFFPHLADLNIRYAYPGQPYYANMLANNFIEDEDTTCPNILWVRGIKR